MGVLVMIPLRCAWYDGTLDHRMETLRQFIEDGFHDPCIARTRFGVRRCWYGDVGHVDMIRDI